MPLNQDIEIVNPPEDSSEASFKIVQLFVRGSPVMVCGPRNIYHGDILANYLISRNISYTTFTVKDYEVGERDLPNLEGEDYNVVGMGEANSLDCTFGTSIDYRIRPNSDFNVRLEKQFPTT